MAATFTNKQQQLCRHAVRQGLVGKQLGAVLRTKPEEASRRTGEIITLAYEGFGALVLAREGRSHCPKLARILDQAAWRGDNFTPKLRQRIVRHLNTCLRCDNCTTQRDRLIKPLTPALVPVLVTPVVKDKVDKDIKQRTRTQLNRILNEIGNAFLAVLSVAVVAALIIGGLFAYDAGVPDGSIPVNWVGCGTATDGAGTPCTVTLNQNASVCLVPFNPLQPNLMTIDECRSRAGQGSGEQRLMSAHHRHSRKGGNPAMECGRADRDGFGKDLGGGVIRMPGSGLSLVNGRAPSYGAAAQ